ncbi:uncharacterized ATP-dependent helicase YprA isoform X2 [Jatropha curcas]|uniref:uncharacterized ATP-dependent helicase YprA isoform X2 n=1 Tax=Jatropha curcas TaxID=180498 RepID=UPI0009D6D9C3|nr:uncharacterized ATP-dependent helicase YprA isoform X2 [Jatropha curcas]
MAEEEREIEVRTLTGESTTVFIGPNKTISDLKLLLTLTFPPASSSPNFHLFFKGVKLGLQSRISSTEPGELLVLVPFIKKDKPQTPSSDFSTNLPKQSLNSAYADSVYSDMMQEFSSFLDQSNDTNASYSGCKRKRVFENYNDKHEEEGPYAFLWSTLQSSNKNIIDDQNSRKFVEVLESLNCLRSPHFGTCILLGNRANSDSGLYSDNKVSCFCPAWLKRIMKAFAFLNIFSAFLQMQKEEITSTRLKDALKQLSKFGFGADFEDIEHIAILCSKVVSFTSNETNPGNSADALIIINSESEERKEILTRSRNDQKAMSLSKIFTVIRKRENSFKTDLWTAARLLMGKSGNAITMHFSLEDLLKFVKEGGVPARGNKAKKEKGSQFIAPRSYSFRTRCSDTNKLLPAEMLQHLREGTGANGQIVHVEDIGARNAICVEIPHELSDNIKSSLKCMGITKLYSHQAESIMASLAGKNVVVSTMTSSGKSLCYNIPVLEVLSQNLDSCALYLFPTKALAQDQLRALLAMTNRFDTAINIGIYDGDTSQRERPELRANTRLLITNPDMLHMTILPFHRQFSRILSNLRFVVIDEAHAYRGAFGCHTALILRRLRRICSHVYGSDPSFIFSTATSANPREHCMELANLSTLELINNDGSPSSQKLFALWNPLSYPGTASNKDDSLTANKKSRREILQKTAPHLVDLICAYRAGYTAEDRRKIESDFFSGKLCGVAATNALELGIDVGHIDATLHLGFPGSIASLWQQAGRSGRREKPSLAVYVAFEGPLDQYFMKFPKKLFSSPIECNHIDAQNQQVLEQQLVCAAFEHPLSVIYDEKHFGAGLSYSIMTLKNMGYLSSDLSHDSSARIWSYIGREKIPSHGISIRAIETVRYRVVDRNGNEVLEEIEESKAFFQVYEGAVYMHQGKTYLVEVLNVSEKFALCRRADLKYYTKTRDYTDVHVCGGDIAYPARVSKNQSLKTTAQASHCKVTTTWFGFYCIQRGTNNVLDKFDLSLPKYSYDSQAVWIQVPQSVKNTVLKDFPFREGLHAASHALLKLVPLYIRCNSSDLAPECPNPHDTRYCPERILIYDQHPGGTGVTKQIQPYFTELLNAALELLTSCHCSGVTGCPSCVQSLACHEFNEEIHKGAAIVIIKGVLDAEKDYFKYMHDSSHDPRDQCPDS